MKTVCELNMCVGCSSCVTVCLKDAIVIKDDLKTCNAVISEDKCVNCYSCFKVCQNNNFPNLHKPISWFQGWNNNDNERLMSSSGGAAYLISKKFIQEGGAVCSCLFKKGEFIFSIIEDETGLSRFLGSKYVKSDMGYIYNDIAVKIKEKKVLFIGLPCQVAALKNFIPSGYDSRLYTADLICHGCPSKKILSKFLKESEIDIDKIEDIRFREKEHYQLSILDPYLDDWISVGKNGTCDSYTYLFLSQVCYTENCYSCRFAKIERVSDLTFGDSWGSQLDKTEKNKGISLILSQTEKGNQLIQNSGLELHSVEIKRAVQNNQQLITPAKSSLKRKVFFNVLIKSQNFKLAFFLSCPKAYIKNKFRD